MFNHECFLKFLLVAAIFKTTASDWLKKKKKNNELLGFCIFRFYKLYNIMLIDYWKWCFSMIKIHRQILLIQHKLPVSSRIIKNNSSAVRIVAMIDRSWLTTLLLGMARGKQRRYRKRYSIPMRVNSRRVLKERVAAKTTSGRQTWARTRSPITGFRKVQGVDPVLATYAG